MLEDREVKVIFKTRTDKRQTKGRIQKHEMMFEEKEKSTGLLQK